MRTQDEMIRIERESYALAWEEFSRSAGLTPDERESGPRLLRSYVHIMVDVGFIDSNASLELPPMSSQFSVD